MLGLIPYRSIIVLFLLIPLGIFSFTNLVYADHMVEVVSVPAGTSVPGCEETYDCFIPFELFIDVGSEVVWINDDTAAHTVTSGTSPAWGGDGVDGIFDSSLFMTGDAYSWVFDEAGEYPYFCMVHPWMQGIVIVSGPDTFGNFDLAWNENEFALFGENSRIDFAKTGETFSIWSEVANVGVDESPRFAYYLILLDESGQEVFGEEARDHFPLEAGHSLGDWWEMTLGDVGIYEAIFWVEPLGDVLEGNENNNGFSFFFEILSGTWSVIETDKSAYIIGTDMIVTLVDPEYGWNYEIDFLSLGEITVWHNGQYKTTLLDPAFDSSGDWLIEIDDRSGIFQAVVNIPNQIGSTTLQDGDTLELRFEDHSTPDGSVDTAITEIDLVGEPITGYVDLAWLVDSPDNWVPYDWSNYKRINTPMVGEEFTIPSKFDNLGNMDAPPVTIKFEVIDEFDNVVFEEFRKTLDVPFGVEEQGDNWPITINKPGHYIANYVLDYYDEVDEPNETNNFYYVGFVVEFSDFVGIPPTDTDNDGIPDDKDSCVTQAENYNNYQDTDGCPDSPPTTSNPPTILVQDKITADSGDRVYYNAKAIDAEDGDITRKISCNPQSGSILKDGETRVTCSVTDSDGNTVRKSFTVSVQSAGISIPPWVTSVAEWYCSGAVDEASFLEGIQYLISTDVIKVQATSSGASSSQSVPAWIKNNACWWSQGLITNEDFASGIEYLINQGIIRI